MHADGEAVVVPARMFGVRLVAGPFETVDVPIVNHCQAAGSLVFGMVFGAQ
ncbi:hypothetical protein [Paraburkholderia acidisoli]|uniref:Uncharacterized protein n=1 Tax=Paraburkholderia acidisoli TaxID=2571748 RepID=A0A7Z2JF45_9BURK|nr:hypothetical protein [Paraburkholderia acidisoli]QGZ61104.1 hypothetical protein FAZ98_04785 [Paraburkholderia acidisoli]